MKSASYRWGTCFRCHEHQYALSHILYTDPDPLAPITWHDMREKVLFSRYIDLQWGNCIGCRSVGRGHALVLAQLLYRLDLLPKL